MAKIPTLADPISVALYPKEKRALHELAGSKKKRFSPYIRELIRKELEDNGYDIAKLQG